MQLQHARVSRATGLGAVVTRIIEGLKTRTFVRIVNLALTLVGTPFDGFFVGVAIVGLLAEGIGT